MITREKLKMKSAFSKLLVSYVIVFIVPIVITCASYIWSTNILKGKIKKYNLSMLTQVQRVMDERLKSIEQIFLGLSTNNRINNFMYKKSLDRVEDVYNMQEVSEDISRYVNINSYVDDIFVYFKNLDIILSNKSKYTMELFYNEVLPYEKINFNTWKEMIDKPLYKQYISEDLGKLKNTDKTIVTLLNPLPYCSILDNKTLGTMGITIDSNKLKEMLKDINLGDKGAIYILDRNNESIISINSSEYLPYIIKNINLEKHTESINTKISNKKVTISYVNSYYNDWKYVVVVPTNDFIKELIPIKIVLILFIILQLILSLILAYKMSMINYSPVKSIVDYLSQTLNLKFNNEVNEFTYISNLTSSTIEENIIIKEKIKEQFSLVKNSYLLQLINGETDEKQLKEISKHIGLDYNKYFSVLIINIEDYGDVVKYGKLEEKILVKGIIRNTISTFLNNNISYNILEYDLQRLVVIINTEYIKGYQDYIKDICNKIREELIKKYSVFTNISVGNLHSSAEGVFLSYKEALKAIEYKIVKGKSSVILYEELNDFKDGYYYPLNIETQLINSIKVGDYNKADELLKDIINNNFKKKNLTLFMAKCVFFDIIATIIKIYYDLMASKEVIDNRSKLIEKLINCSSVDEMYINISSLIYDICEYVNMNKKSHNDEMKENILNWIHENYDNSNLSLNLMSSVLNITPNYISRFFKEQVGENLMDYINKIRICKSKELMINYNLSINNISEKVGYTNSSIYIRTFKKYEGVTPGQYKNALLSKREDDGDKID